MTARKGWELSGFITARNEEHELVHPYGEMAYGLLFLYLPGKEHDYEVNLERYAALWSGIDTGQTLPCRTQ